MQRGWIHLPPRRTDPKEERVKHRHGHQRQDRSEGKAAHDRHRHRREKRIRQQWDHAENRRAGREHHRAQTADRSIHHGLVIRNTICTLQVDLFDQNNRVLHQHPG